jgi:hypothetical protein
MLYTTYINKTASSLLFLVDNKAVSRCWLAAKPLYYAKLLTSAHASLDY